MSGTTGRGRRTWRPIAQSRQGNRRVMTTVVIVVALISAIAWTNREGGDDEPSVSDRSRQGAMDAAEHVAVTIGSTKMYGTKSRAQALKSIVHPTEYKRLLADANKGWGYMTDQLKLDDAGQPPHDQTLISETDPIDSKVQLYSNEGAATVDVHASGKFGIEGSSEVPIDESEFTVTVELEWDDGRWWATNYNQD